MTVNDYFNLVTQAEILIYFKAKYSSVFLAGYSGVDDDNDEDELIANFGGKVDTIELWLRLELTREAKHWLPMRVTEGKY